MSNEYVTTKGAGENTRPYGDTGERTFSAFVATDYCRQKFGPDPTFYARLLSTKIESLNALKSWAKERYPDHYSSDWRKTIGKPYSREPMGQLWADFLSWKEAAND